MNISKVIAFLCICCIIFGAFTVIDSITNRIQQSISEHNTVMYTVIADKVEYKNLLRKRGEKVYIDEQGTQYFFFGTYTVIQQTEGESESEQ